MKIFKIYFISKTLNEDLTNRKKREIEANIFININVISKSYGN